MAETPTMKGTALKATVDFAKAKGGEQTWNVILNSLDEKERKIFSGVILSSETYPLESYQKFLVTVSTHLAKGNPEIGLDIGHTILKQGLSGVYRAFLGIVTPNWIIRKTPLLWNRYLHGEYLKLEKVEQGSLTATVSGELMPLKVFCYAVLGSMMQTIKLAGGKEVIGNEIECRSDGYPCCRFVVRWK